MGANKNIGIIVLAAGASSRLGHPKQLVELNGIPLLRKITEIAINTRCTPIVVVLGAYFNKIKPTVEKLPVHILKNKKWETGMGSSIASGMGFLIKKHPQLKAVILLVCDQYFLSEKIILELISTWEKTGKNIVASQYGETIGVPAIFSKELFNELKRLDSTGGAKKIINRYDNQIGTILFQQGSFDLDTEKDLSDLNKPFRK